MKFYGKLFVFIFFFLVKIILSQTKITHSISGIITDHETGNPITSANIFLDGTTFGSISDRNGEYIISNIPSGSYKLVASMVGYKRQDSIITLIDQSIIDIDFKLPLQSYQLEEIEITTERDYNWQSDFEKFWKSFIGTSANSRYCKIINKEILEFTKDNEHILKGKTHHPLIIENLALGYRIFFDLKNFMISKASEVTYFGNVRFEELTPKDIEEKIEWEEKREEAFNGSFRHFLMSLCRDKLEGNGFYLYYVNYPNWDDLRNRDFFIPTPANIVERITTIERSLHFNRYIMVIYNKEWEDKAFQIHRNYFGSKIFRELDFQTSWFQLPYGFTMFDINGNIIDNYKSVKVYGYWGWQKVADLLPTDYLPDKFKTEVF